MALLETSARPDSPPAIEARQSMINHAAVITAIQDAESILIFGPGEAKGELKERLEKITSADIL